MRTARRIQFAVLAATWGSSFLFIKVLTGYRPAVWVGRLWLHLAVTAVFRLFLGIAISQSTFQSRLSAGAQRVHLRADPGLHERAPS